jgi:hypothetical protein
MAIGQGQGGGLMAFPDVPDVGQATWGEMTAMHPDSPLVGGRGAPTGGIDPDFKYRRVAVGGATAMPHPGAESVQGHFTEMLNFRGNPLPWICILAIAYLGLFHLQVGANAGVGLGRKGR